MMWIEVKTTLLASRFSESKNSVALISVKEADPNSLTFRVSTKTERRSSTPPHKFMHRLPTHRVPRSAYFYMHVINGGLSRRIRVIVGNLVCFIV